jgi:hypothetical protein
VVPPFAESRRPPNFLSLIVYRCADSMQETHACREPVLKIAWLISGIEHLAPGDLGML